MDSQFLLYLVPLPPSQAVPVEESAAANIIRVTELIQKSGVVGAPAHVFILRSSGVIDTVPLSEILPSGNSLETQPSFALLFCEGDFEVSPPTKHFIEQFRFLFRTIAAVYPLSPATVHSIVHQGGNDWMIGEIGVHPLYLIEHINRLCSEATTYCEALSSEGWYSASFEEIRTVALEGGKTRITGWVQNTGIHSWSCGSAMGAVRLGLLGRIEDSSSFELRFDFERSTILPGEGACFTFEFQESWEWIEIDCVVENQFWFGHSNPHSKCWSTTKCRNENLIDGIAKKNVLLIARQVQIEGAFEKITALQHKCENVGIQLRADLDTPTHHKSYDLLYVDFDSVAPSVETVVALRKSAYEFSDIGASSPLFFDASLDIILYGSKSTSSSFYRELWGQSLGGVLRRVVDSVPLRCVYVRDATIEQIEEIKRARINSVTLGRPIVVSTSVTLNLLEKFDDRKNDDRMSLLGECTLP